MTSFIYFVQYYIYFRNNKAFILSFTFQFHFPPSEKKKKKSRNNNYFYVSTLFSFYFVVWPNIARGKPKTQIFWKHSSPDVITQGAGLRARSCPGCVCVRSLLVCAEKQEEMPLPVQVFNFQVKLFRIYFLRSYFIT